MDIKLKNKILSYFKNIWLIEICIVLISGFYIISDIYKSNESGVESKVVSAVLRTIYPKGYYGEKFKNEIKGLNEDLYENYEFKDTINSIDNEFLGDKNYKYIKGYFGSNVKFILINKNTDTIVTHDEECKNDFDYDTYLDNDPSALNNEIESFINSRFRKVIVVHYDNSEKNNKNPTLKIRLKNQKSSYLQKLSKEYEEYYYTTSLRYYDKSESRMSWAISLYVFIVSFILLKIVGVIIFNKKVPKIRGNFISNFIYVARYGFKFSQTRKTLIISIIGLILFFITYLYFLALGGYENNLIVSFFSTYPFKGSFLLMILPMIGILYSIRKSIEIYMVTENLKEINKGNLDFKIVEQGSPEIRELVKDIVQIKDGYKIAANEILKNEKMKTELISNVSHDLRTPLTSIINYVNILQDKSLSEEEKNECIQIIDQKSKKLKVLIDDLFEMSKINSGKMELHRERIELMSLVHQVIGEYSYLYEEKHIEFVIEGDKEEYMIDLDGKLMSRVVENIVINALKYSLENTRVFVEFKETDKYVSLSFKNVANYNMDFDNEDIFGRFVRGDKSRNSNVEGSGLGLAITKSIVELHNGKVNINTEGDMFKIYILLPKNNNY